MLKEVVGDESVAYLPHEVGQKNQQRQAYPAPEPSAQEKSSVARQQKPAEYSRHIKEDRVLGHQAKTHG
jgi:hypothetical protein